LDQLGDGFGSTSGLRVQGKIFAMLRDSDLLLKLPKDQVEQLVASGVGARFAPRRDGRLMREWATVPAGYSDHWEPLATQALQFVRPAGS
jgi:hypothetical protein